LGVASALLAALAVQQGITAHGARADASAMVQDGVLAPGSDPAEYDALVRKGDRAERNAWISAGVSAALAVGAGVLGWRTPAPASGPQGGLAFAF
jgi:hypothetical protein